MPNLIKLARETMNITERGEYEVEGRKIKLCVDNPQSVEVFDKERLEAASAAARELPDAGGCEIRVVNGDSFECAAGLERPLVMNFANAHHAGGGFLLGAKAQEEALCRASTLYASISSEAAKKMYRYNNTHISPVDSDYMLLSPEVCVFRSSDGELLTEPYNVAVWTAPAPNRRGAAFMTSCKRLDEVMTERIRKFLSAAAVCGYPSIVAGAWGCGAFGHSAERVSGYFRKILIDENYMRLFRTVVFAVLDRKNGGNIKAFEKTFEDR